MSNAFATRQRGRQAMAAAEKRSRVRELYLADLTDEQIAQQLDIDRSRVTQIRKQLCLPPRWGRKNGFVFSVRHDRDLQELKSTTRFSWGRIAFLLGIPEAVVYARYRLLLTTMPGVADAKIPERIECRRCKQPFLTPNRRQIHMCDNCHRRIEALGASLDDDSQDSVGFRIAV